MGRVKDMELAIREADISKLNGEQSVLTEAAKLLVTLQDVLSGIVSEQGVEALARYTREAGILIGRSGQVALALKAMADGKGTGDPDGIWVLWIDTPYNGEAPTLTYWKTRERAKAAMEADIRETMADWDLDEALVTREDDEHAHFENRIEWHIEEADLGA